MRRTMNVDHHSIAAACRAVPGEWVYVGEYNSSQSAAGIVGRIRRALVKLPHNESPYAPAGSYEARHRLTEFGAEVDARYTGPGREETA